MRWDPSHRPAAKTVSLSSLTAKAANYNENNLIKWLCVFNSKRLNNKLNWTLGYPYRKFKTELKIKMTRKVPNKNKMKCAGYNFAKKSVSELFIIK